MKKISAFARRSFIGTGLVTLGAGMGWMVRKFQGPNAVRKKVSTSLDSGTVYDVSEFEKTDPALLRYDPSGQFETGFDRVKRLKVAPGNQLMVAGDRSIRFFNASGTPGIEIQLDRPPHCMELIDNKELFVGLGNYFAVYDLDGKEMFRSERLGERAFLTALVVHEKTIYIADAGSREILMADRGTGAVIDRFGKKDKARNNPGFAVPSPYFDLAIGADERLRIVNPGRLRVETYTLDGRFESSWGQPGLAVDRFCGCCNPVYFTTRSDGSFITSEKGLTRVNIYDPNGKFQGVVAGPDVLVDDKELAKRACNDCRVGAGFDVAVGEDGTVYVLDAFRKSVRSFVPKAKA